MDYKSLLNDQQYRAVRHTNGPLLVLAGAGSGKTRVLTYRIAYLIDEEEVNPWNILALTFTNKAAAEMRERIDDLIGSAAQSIWVSTFHSACVRMLRKFIDSIGYTSSFTIYDTADQKTLIKDVIKSLNIDSKTYKDTAVLNRISSAKDKLISPAKMLADAGSDYDERTIARIYERYQDQLKSNNALDFDDIIFKTVELFRQNPEALNYYQRRFRYILVDEYQDTNHAQFVLISMLASYTNEAGEIEHNLCVVCDDDQSIYRFRGADVANILDFEKVYPDTTTIKLEQNYRSTKSILNCANEVIHNNIFRKAKKLWTDNPDGELVSFTQYETSQDEAVNVIKDIKRRRHEDGCTYNDFAILYRTNSQTRLFEEMLVRENIPYKIVGGQNFYGRKEIKDILAYLRVINNPDDDIQVKRIINVPRRGIGATTIARLTDYAQEHDLSFYTALSHAESIPGLGRSVDKLNHFAALIDVFRSKASSPAYTLEELVNELLDTTGYTDELKAENSVEANTRLEYIEEFVNKVIAYEEDAMEETSLEAFLEEVSLVADIDSYDEADELVVLMTLHGSKGLEFPYVYLTGMEEGLFPSYRSINSGEPEDIDEERRLCYVGITRARKELMLTAAKLRMINGETMYSKPSRFIGEIPRHMLKMNIPESSKKKFGSSFNTSFNNDYSSKKNRFSTASSFATGSSTSAKSRFSPRSSKGNSNSLDNNPFISKGFAGLNSNTIFDKQTPSTNTIDYTVGDTVSHNTFGTGTVTEMTKKDNDYIVTVEFKTMGVKKMKASFAKLKKL